VTTGAKGLHISGAYPNPFATQTEVRWQQSTGSAIVLNVYTQSGQLVQQHELGYRSAGVNSARVDAALLPNGTYHFELRSESEVARGTLTVVR
jgi:hypothetical protein